MRRRKRHLIPIQITPHAKTRRYGCIEIVHILRRRKRPASQLRQIRGKRPVVDIMRRTIPIHDLDPATMPRRHNRRRRNNIRRKRQTFHLAQPWHRLRNHAARPINRRRAPKRHIPIDPRNRRPRILRRVKRISRIPLTRTIKNLLTRHQVRVHHQIKALRRCATHLCGGAIVYIVDAVAGNVIAPSTYQLPTSLARLKPRWMSVSLAMPRQRTLLPGGASRVRFR
jgi:hypothetical protein